MALTPEQEALNFNPELQDVSRQRKLADLLMAQGMQQPQGQMISGHYVAPSFTQQLNPLANILAGQAVGERADTKQAEMASALRTQGNAAVQKVMQTFKQNPNLGVQEAAQLQQFPQVKALLPTLAKALEQTPEERRYQAAIADGSWKPEKMGGFNAFMNQMTEAQKESAKNERIRTGIAQSTFAADYGVPSQGGGLPQGSMPTIGQGSPILAKPLMQGTMPAAGVNPFADYNNSVVPPAGLIPKDARKYMAEANTPLTGDASTKVQGGLDTIDAIDNYRKILTDYSKLSSLNPTQRANLQAAYYTMTLKSKEANKLGVLNGRDQEILEKLTPNPNDIKSLLVTNDVLSEQALKQRNLITGFTVNAYGEQRKKIPDYVVNKIQPLKTEITPSQASKIERPSMIDETTWGFMTPQEKSLFKR